MSRLPPPSCRFVIPLANGRAEVVFAPEAATAWILHGKTAEEAVRLVGLVHNLCGAAHRAAASAALGLPVRPEMTRETLLEILRGHLVILARTAPAILGVESPLPGGLLGALGRPGMAGDVARKLPRLATAISGGGKIFNGKIFNGKTFGLQALLAPGAAFADFLRACLMLEAQSGLFWPDFETDIPDPSFFARVTEDRRFGVPDAFGPVSRRFLGRIFEMLDLIAMLGTPREAMLAAQSPSPGEATVQAGRGRLTHRATVVDGRIAAYAIETPTTAMLAHGGALHVFLRMLGRRPDLDPRLIRLAVLAFDPCLPHRIDFHGRMTPVEEALAHA